MSSIYFPIAAAAIAILINIIYFTKPNINNKENKIYSGLIIISLIQCLLNCFAIFLIKKYNIIIPFFHRLDLILILLWISGIFVYIFSISFKPKNYSKFLRAINITNFIIALFLLFTPMEVINKPDILDTSGLAPIIVYLSTFIYTILSLVGMFYSLIKKNVNKVKFVPLNMLIILVLIALLLRSSMPNLVIEPFIIAFVNLIMYFTIENPDIKMLEKVNIAKKEVEKSNKIKSEFLSSMSHEIRTPLNAIVGFSQLILNAETKEEAQENASDIINASNTLLIMLTNVLDIAQVEASNLSLNIVKYDLREAVCEICELFKYKLDEKMLDLDLDISNIPKILVGDVDKVKRILANLIDNAIKYTKIGYITVTVKGVNKNNICEIEMIVKDTGCGMSKQIKENLFKSFARDEKFKDSNTSGMGLGLSITKSLVEIMKGTITCDSKLDEGTCFKVKFKQDVGD